MLMKTIVESIIKELARKKGVKAKAPSVGNIPHGQLDLNAGEVLDETGIRIHGEYYKGAQDWWGELHDQDQGRN